MVEIPMSPTAFAFMAISAAFIPAQPPKAQPQGAKWEYKEVKIDVARIDPFGKEDRDKTIEEMNTLGKEGWDCIQIMIGESRAGAPSRASRILYKRRTDSTAQAIWVYSVADPASDTLQSVTKQLSKLSDDGWELASIVPRPFAVKGPGSASDSVTAYLLKRPK